MNYITNADLTDFFIELLFVLMMALYRWLFIYLFAEFTIDLLALICFNFTALSLDDVSDRWYLRLVRIVRIDLRRRAKYLYHSCLALFAFSPISQPLF